MIWKWVAVKLAQININIAYVRGTIQSLIFYWLLDHMILRNSHRIKDQSGMIFKEDLDLLIITSILNHVQRQRQREHVCDIRNAYASLSIEEDYIIFYFYLPL